LKGRVAVDGRSVCQALRDEGDAASLLLDALARRRIQVSAPRPFDDGDRIGSADVGTRGGRRIRGRGSDVVAPGTVVRGSFAVARAAVGEPELELPVEPLPDPLEDPPDPPDPLLLDPPRPLELPDVLEPLEPLPES
jgi:hypothetical protein